ncbi:MAG: hypothetical protein AABY22_22595, partial [Nanoarchaeota archaeon]
LFGEYLHHDPSGENGSKTQDEFSLIFEKQTQLLYYMEFGEYIYQINIGESKMKKLFRKLFMSKKKAKSAVCL